MYKNDWYYLVYILNKSLVHICGICAHSRSFSNKNILRSFCWWSPFSNHFVDGLLLVNMFIITTKMHIDEGLFCKHVYYQYKNLSYRIILILFGWRRCLTSVDVWRMTLSDVCWCLSCRSTVPPPISAFTVYKTQILRKNICLSLKSASVSTHLMKNQSILISLLPHVSALSNNSLSIMHDVI